MTRPADRERLEALEREPREPEPPPPFPEPAVLAMQRTAGNQAVTRFLQRQPNLAITDRQAAAGVRWRRREPHDLDRRQGLRQVGDVEAHGSSEGGGASIRTPGGSKAGFEIGKSIKIDVKAGDLARMMAATQTAFGESGAAILAGASVENVIRHGPALKKAVTDAADRARKSAAQTHKPGWSVGATVKGDKSGGYSGTVTLTWG